MRFSYRGGVVADQPYRPADTGVDMAVAARRLRQVLQRVGEQNPGVPIDLLAHSQGGVVARAALAYEFDGLDPELPKLGALVTLASPHEGSDLGTIAHRVGESHSGQLLERGIAAGTGGGLDPRWTSVQQLAVSSPFIRRLNRRPLPSGLRATSIAARGDLVVTAGRTELDGAEHVTVTVTGLVDDHGSLPGSAVAYREIALGLAGMPPTCQGRLDSLADEVVPSALTFTEATVGTGLWAVTESVG
jgi:pimeloyl-ACP methyl ester carboxylesterase